MKRRVAVLFHELDRERDLSCYVVFHLARLWRESGLDVAFVFGVGRFLPADAALLHVDLSIVPPEYLEFAGRYPIALNAGIADIRKSTVSRCVLREGDPWDGPVIVKTDLNYAGLPERTLERHGLAAAPAGTAIPIDSPRDYRIFDGVDAVPPAVFRDPRLVVERFLPERDGDLYVSRSYYFLGDRGSCTYLASEDPIVGAHTAHVRRNVEPHPEIVAARRRLGFDYGKFDYVMHEGRPVLHDTNKTTGAGNDAASDWNWAQWRYRAPGILAYLR